MFDALSFDVFDGLLLAAVLLVSGIIAYSDWKTQTFPLYLWLVYTALGGAWCVKQAFIPLSLIPLGLGLGLMALYNHYVRGILGYGDILLLLSSGCFIPMDELGLFLILCGGFGVLQFAVLRLTGRTSQRIPFSGSILAAMMTAFVLILK